MAFLLLKLRFFQVEPELEPPQHVIADGAAVLCWLATDPEAAIPHGSTGASYPTDG